LGRKLNKKLYPRPNGIGRFVSKILNKLGILFELGVLFALVFVYKYVGIILVIKNVQNNEKHLVPL